MRRLEAFERFQDADTAQKNLNRAFEGVGYDVVLELMDIAQGLLGQEPGERNYGAFFQDVQDKTGNPYLAHRQGLALVHAFETNEGTWRKQLELRAATVRTMNQQAATNQAEF